MKNIQRISLALGVAVIGGSAAYPNGPIPLPGEYPANEAKVSFEKVERGAVLKLKDKPGNTLFRERIRTDGDYSRGFDLSKLPDAEYYFELDKENVIQVVPFRVRSNTVEFVENTEYKITKPQFQLKGDLLYISNASDENQTVEIKVYYEGRELAYSESLSAAKNIRRVYDFSGSITGQYNIVVNSDGREFVENIKAGNAY